MQPKSLAATIFDLCQAIENCENQPSGYTSAAGSPHPWLAKHRASLKSACALLPSGSGIDNGTKFVQASAATERIQFTCGYHHMNDQGSYDGWTEHVINVKPSWSGMTITISGSNRNDVKEYLHDVFSETLSTLVVFDSETDRWLFVEETNGVHQTEH
jgi:hypothetical protein